MTLSFRPAVCVLICLLVNVNGARLDMGKIQKRKKEQRRKAAASQHEPCTIVSKEVRSMEAAGAEGWQGIYKCLHQSNNEIVFIQCAYDTQQNMQDRWDTNAVEKRIDDSPGRPRTTVALDRNDFRDRFGAGEDMWQKAVPVQAACWVRSKADLLQQWTHQLEQGVQAVGGGIQAVTGALSSWLSLGQSDEAQKDVDTFFSSSAEPRTPGDQELVAAIAAFAAKSSDPAGTRVALTEFIITSGRWKDLNMFERSFAVSALKGFGDTASGVAALVNVSKHEPQVAGQRLVDVSKHEPQSADLVQVPEQHTQSAGLLEVAEVVGAQGQNFFLALIGLIGKLLGLDGRSRARRAQNHYMSMNIGWGHVRSNMRRDGWRL